MSRNQYQRRWNFPQSWTTALVLLCLSFATLSAAAPQERWAMIGSTLLSRIQGTTYVFAMEAPHNAFASQGVLPGDVILEVERDGQVFSGVAYAFLTGCHRESYEVTGSLSADEQSIELSGRRPVRTADCVIRSYQDDTMTLSKVTAVATTPAPPPPVPPPAPTASVPSGNQAPSFDCSGRLAPDEATICADPALARLDQQLAAIYRRLRARLDQTQSLRLRDEQRLWVSQRHGCVTDRHCLTTSFQSRIAQLENWR
jgi:uncharacterized protein